MNWEESQQDFMDRYKKARTATGFFSVNGIKGAEMIGRAMNQYIHKGLCLDVGCGILRKPSYMQHAPKVTFIGIDPYKGSRKRTFPFVEGYAESLPFRNNLFNGVLFATSLDHLKDPEKGIVEARRVLKKNGYLFIWGGMEKDDGLHLWKFDIESTLKLLIGFKRIHSIKVRPRQNKETILIMQK